MARNNLRDDKHHLPQPMRTDMIGAAAARALGGSVTGHNRISCPGPGHSRHDRSLSVTLTADGGFVCHSHAGDAWQACRDHVARLLGLEEWQPSRRERVGRNLPTSGGFKLNAVQHVANLDPAPPDPRVGAAMVIWTQASPPGEVVRNYLGSRGLTMPAHLEDGRGCIRYHPKCPMRLDDGSRGEFAAMVCLFCDIESNTPTGIHRIALQPDGRGKALHPLLLNVKQMLGRTGGSAVKLTPDEDVTSGIGICEGVESGIALLNLGFAPVWAAGSAGAIKSFPVLSGVEAVTIFADNDPTGVEAAQVCAARWEEEDRQATILAAPRPGGDWNDLVVGGGK